MEERVVTFAASAVKNTDLARSPKGLAVVTPPCRLTTPEGAIVMAATVGQTRWANTHRALRPIPAKATSTRQGGMVSRSLTFGWLPRANGRMRPYCKRSALDSDTPVRAELEKMAAEAERFYRSEAPAPYANHEAVAATLPSAEYRFAGTVFTSGIVNFQSPLTLHRDAGNAPDAWSVMYVVRRRHNGGNLVLPELGIELACPDGTIVVFHGQRYLHGVTPIGVNDERTSVVFYSMAEVWRCLPAGDELAQARRVRTLSERRRAGRPTP